MRKMICLIAGLIAIQAYALDYKVEGQITDLFSQPDTLPIQGAIINLSDYPDATETLTDTTDENGYFCFEANGTQETNGLATPIPKINSHLVGDEVNLNIYFNNFENGGLELMVFDLSGRKVENKLKILKQGKNSFNIDLKEKASGPYFYQIIKDGKIITKGKLTLFKGLGKSDIDLNKIYVINKNYAKAGQTVIKNNTYKLIITNPTNQHYQRITYKTINSDTFINENLADTSLPMDFFDEVCRYNPFGVTQRRLTQCIWYIDTSAAIGSGIQPTQAQIDSVLRIIRDDIPVFTDYKISGDDEFIEIGNNPPPLGTEPYHIVLWNDEIPVNGAHVEILDGHEIIAAHVYLRTDAPIRSVYLQELTQNLGGRCDTDYYSNSVFYSWGGSHDYSDIDLKLGKFLYNRPIKNTTPDTDFRPF